MRGQPGNIFVPPPPPPPQRPRSSGGNRGHTSARPGSRPPTRSSAAASRHRRRSDPDVAARPVSWHLLGQVRKAAWNLLEPSRAAWWIHSRTLSPTPTHPRAWGPTAGRRGGPGPGGPRRVVSWCRSGTRQGLLSLETASAPGPQAMVPCSGRGNERGRAFVLVMGRVCAHPPPPQGS